MLNGTDLGEDVAFLLYLVPLLASGAYGLVLWSARGLSASLPSDIFLAVTKDPRLFLAGVIAVCIGALLEIYLGKDRALEARENASRMQLLAAVAAASAALSAWSASGYSGNLVSVLDLLVTGRFSLLYPAMILFASLLISSSLRREVRVWATLLEGAALLLVAASPVALYVGWRLRFEWGNALLLATALLAAGVGLIVVRGTAAESA